MPQWLDWLGSGATVVNAGNWHRWGPATMTTRKKKITRIGYTRWNRWKMCAHTHPRCHRQIVRPITTGLKRGQKIYAHLLKIMVLPIRAMESKCAKTLLTNKLVWRRL